MASRFILDMVHHNPGEAPFPTTFLNPEKLNEFGYNGQVFKHINCAVGFAHYDAEIFAQGTEEKAWLDAERARIKAEIQAARDAGIRIFYHIDLFVLPKKLVEIYRDAICDENGRISIEKDKTLEIHRALFAEIFADFDIDGLIVRHGETYLLDTPFHTGNGPVPLYGEFVDKPKEKPRFEKLLNFLRDEVCVKHDKWLMFRTWDICKDRFHANPRYYLDVTDRIEPHEKLLFSIKHTQMDFFRRIPVNPCLNTGRHKQIIEVQCQREYEGKGAYPNYVANGIINGFEEDQFGASIGKIVADETHFTGFYTWSRGGGWYGPYLKNEFWCELNSYVIAQWANDTSRSEEEIFRGFAEKHGITGDSYEAFRELALKSATGVLKGRYCEVEHLDLCWMRDQNLGGLNQLGENFENLYKNDLFAASIAEKREASEAWSAIVDLSKRITSNSKELDDYIQCSALYGKLIFDIVRFGWEVMVAGFVGDKTGSYDAHAIKAAAEGYHAAWKMYKTLPEKYAQCASLYLGQYWSWPGNPPAPGMEEEVQKYVNKVQ